MITPKNFATNVDTFYLEFHKINYNLTHDFFNATQLFKSFLKIISYFLSKFFKISLFG